MFSSEKIVTVGSISDFLVPRDQKEVNVLLATIPISLASSSILTFTSKAHAETPFSLIHAFDPLIEIIQSLAYPVGFVMICAGFLVIMTGNKTKGLHIIKWAALGFLGMQFAPGLMTLLGEVGRSIGK